MGCVNVTLNAPPALELEGVRSDPGDPDDAAIPWSIGAIGGGGEVELTASASTGHSHPQSLLVPK